jgi:LysM repeat protein
MDGWVRALLAASVTGALAGCAAGQPAPAPVTTVTLQPYRTTVAPISAGDSAATIAPLPTAGPSPTPETYSVRANDTFLAIALAYGLSREELLAANPGLNPDLLSIGQQLLIPAPGGQGTATPIPTPTPLPLQMAAPRCFPNASGGLWCLVTVTNTTGSAVEGLSGLLTLIDTGGEPLVTVPIFPPLNVVPADQVMVLAAYLSPPVPAHSGVAATLTMAVPVQEAESRYALLDWTVVRSQPSADRQSWESGIEIRLPADSATTWRVAVTILALDDQGQVIGFAKWEPAAALRPGEQTETDLTVYSLGPAIERVQVLPEALAEVLAAP